MPVESNVVTFEAPPQPTAPQRVTFTAYEQGFSMRDVWRVEP